MLFKTFTRQIDATSIRILVDATRDRRDTMYKLYDRYKAGQEGTPIFTRKYYIGSQEQKDKVNNKLNNDFFGEIIDMKCGFLLGVPIVYSLDKEDMGEEAYEKSMEFIDDFNTTNSVEDLDSETAKRASACGYCGRLFYVEEGTGEIRAKVVDPWECIFVGPSVEEPNTTIRYYVTTDYDENGQEVKTEHADVYDELTITSYTRGEKDTAFTQAGGSVRHLFSDVPLIGFANNDELQGDAEKVIQNIDAYDRALSDVNNEIEQFRLAYLFISGATLKGETLEEAKRTGALSDPSGEAKAEFLVKSLDDAIIEHHLDRLENNIYRFSKTPNMKDISFGGDMSGVAMEFKFRPFEYKCRTTELKFKNALREQYQILADIWNAQGASIDYKQVEFIFTRNYPHNLLEEAQIQQTLKGILSDKTRLSLMSVVNDPEKELEALDEDMEKNFGEQLLRMEQQKELAGDEKPEEKQEEEEEEPPVQG